MIEADYRLKNKKITLSPSKRSFEGQVLNTTNNPSNSSKPLVNSCVQQVSFNTSTPISYKKMFEVKIPKIEKPASFYQLSNGQKIVIIPKKSKTFIQTEFNVGSLNETPSQAGISHFIEHNFFSGSKDLKEGQYHKEVETLGGETNAQTGHNNTSYYIYMQLLDDNSLEEGIKLNAQLTQHPLFSKEYLEKEKGPVKSEIDDGADSEFENLNNICLENLTGISKEILSISGTKENVDSFTREKVMDFYSTYYTPDNSVTYIIGDVDEKKAIELASKYFNKKADLTNISKRNQPQINPIQKTKRTDLISKQDKGACFQIGFYIDEPLNLKEEFALSALLSVLNSSTGDFQNSLENLSDACVFSKSSKPLNSKTKKGRYVLFSAFTKEEKLEKALLESLKNIENISDTPLFAQNLENYKRRYINSSKDFSEGFEQSLSLTKDILETNNPNYLNESIQIVSNLTTKDLIDVAKKYLNIDKTSIAVLHSKDANEKTIKTNYKIANPTQISFGSNYNPIERLQKDNQNVSTETLNNNINLNLINGSNSSSYLVFDFATNSLDDISYADFDILNKMLQKGTIYRNEKNFNQALKEKQDILLALSSHDGLAFSVNFDDFSEENLSNALGFLSELYNYPNFTQENFEKMKKEALEDLTLEEESLGDLINKELYPNKLPFYESAEAYKKRLESLTLDDIKNLYKRILTTSSLDVSCCGAIKDNPNSANLLTNYLAQMPNFKKYNKTGFWQNSSYIQRTKPKLITKEKELKKANIVQTYSFKTPLNIKDVARLKALNLILGGGSYSSRLFKDLRSDKSLVYSAFSSFDTLRDTSSITLETSVTTDNSPTSGAQNIKSVLDSFSSQIDSLKTKNVSQQELQMAKNQLKADILDCIELNSDKLFEYSQDITYSPYSKNYLVELYNAIDSLTVEDIRLCANYVFNSPQLIAIEANKNTLENSKFANINEI